MRPSPLFAAALVAALVLPGCRGYSHRFALPAGAEGIETVAIEIFKNRTLYTDLEFEFAAALQREICAKTSLRIAERRNADAVVTGTIESYDKVVLREFESDDVARYSIVMTVSYTFTRLPSDGGEPRIVSAAEGLGRSAEYEVASNRTEADARQEAVRKLARKLVSHIFETW